MRLAPLSLVLILTACAGHIETRTLDPETLEIDTAKPAIKGVVAYSPQYIKIVHAFTTRVDKDGRLLGSADKQECAQIVQKEEIQIMPDFRKPFVVRQTNGFLTSNKVGVTLTNGMLTSINAESTPQSAEIIAAAPAVLQTLGLPAAELAEAADTMACNSGPRIISFTRAPSPSEAK